MKASLDGRITLDSGKRAGKPCIRSTRITVQDVLGWLASGMSQEEILADYPELDAADIHASLSFTVVRDTLNGPLGSPNLAEKSL